MEVAATEGCTSGHGRDLGHGLAWGIGQDCGTGIACDNSEGHAWI